MAFYTDSIHSDAPKSFLGSFATGLRNIGGSLIRARAASLQMQGRVDRIQALEAKTDAELAEMGLTRDSIVHHVFRDLYYI